MALNLVPSALSSPWAQKGKILPSDGLNAKTIAVGGYTNGQTAPTKVFAVIASNDDTISHDIQIGIMDSTNGFMPLGTVTVPINAGYVGTVPSVNLLSGLAALPLDETGQAYIFMQPTDILQARCTIAAVSTTFKEVDFITLGADF